MGPDTRGLPDEESLRLLLLLLLRRTFPQWDISYATATRAWIARRRAQTICENSPALLAIALILIERRARRPCQPCGGWQWRHVRSTFPVKQRQQVALCSVAQERGPRSQQSGSVWS